MGHGGAGDYRWYQKTAWCKQGLRGGIQTAGIRNDGWAHEDK